MWPARPEHLGAIRAHVRRWLASSGLTGDIQDDIVLAVNEAASNSMEHAYPRPTDDDTVELTLWTEPHAVYVQVVDHGAWLVPSDRPSARGRGIEMMQRLMASVLIHRDTRGTRVLLSQRWPGSPAPDHVIRSDGRRLSGPPGQFGSVAPDHVTWSDGRRLSGPPGQFGSVAPDHVTWSDGRRRTGPS